MFIAMVGLLGTVAVQQTLLSATANANDGVVALRLASQSMEELNARVVAPGNPPTNLMAAAATGLWSNPTYLDSRGSTYPSPSGTSRWARRIRIVDRGLGLPYNVSVEVSYALDTGAAKTVRLDMERRK
jgi:hypothetical protein